ncbi:hypothetical protein FWH09_00485 [Candidatus Saccharibacteria bacterium]|nr:hypothetical protein [Candidatus Saccharibacteria bacterium]
MKFIAYKANSDEREHFVAMADMKGVEYILTSSELNEETVELAMGCDGISDSMLSRKYDEKVYARLQEMDIKYMTVRTAGYDTIDFGLLNKYGIRIANVPAYSPTAIAEHAVMLALSLARKSKIVEQRVMAQDFRREGAVGRELNKMTIGIVGTGHIGFETAKIFKGFGARVLGYDPFPRKETEGVYEQAKDADEIFAECDIISLHMPLVPENKHFINAESIEKMKDGVIIINTARGPHIDNKALAKGLMQEKIGAAGLDVFDFDGKGGEIYGDDYKGRIIKSEAYRDLVDLPNVMFTPHVAYNTDVAIGNMVGISTQNLMDFLEKGECENEVGRSGGGK